MSIFTKNLFLALLLCILPAISSADMAAAPESSAATTLQPVQQSTPSAAAVQGDQTQAAQLSGKIGYVDLIRVSTDSATGKADQTKLFELKKKFQTQIDAKRKQLDKQRAEIEAKLSSLSPQQREAKSKEFGKKVEELQKFALNAEKQLQDIQQELSKSLMEKIEQASSDYGKANGFTAIIVKRDLLYVASGVDVRDATDEIVKLLNSGGKKQ